MDERKNLTVGELIAKLEKLGFEEMVSTYEEDWDYDTWFRHGISGVTSDGTLTPGPIIDAGSIPHRGDDDYDEEEDDE
jgi:hypothetical protein